MLQAKSIDTENYTVYTDTSNKVKKVKHSVIFNSEEKRELEERIVEDLYRIFTHKAG